MWESEVNNYNSSEGLFYLPMTYSYGEVCADNNRENQPYWVYHLILDDDDLLELGDASSIDDHVSNVILYFLLFCIFYKLSYLSHRISNFQTKRQQ